MRCPFCHQALNPKEAWKGTADRFYCGEFCADSETAISIQQRPLKERLDRQYMQRLERLVTLRQQHQAR